MKYYYLVDSANEEELYYYNAIYKYIDTIRENKDDIIQGNFSLKYLVLFTKCTNLSNTVELYLKNDYPLIIKYTVASLGNIKLCLSPQVENSTN